LNLSHSIMTLRLRLRSLFRREHVEQDLNEELRYHLEKKIQEHLAAGLTPEEARRKALREFGGIELSKENCRDTRRVRIIEDLLRDLSFGLRIFRNSPAFALVAILTLALGIGANTAIFTLVHAVILKQLPVVDPRQLYRIGEGDRYCCEWGGLQDSWGIFDYAFYKRLGASNSAFEQIAAFSGNTPSFSARRAGSTVAAQTINGEYVSGNYFMTFGLEASAGRLLGPADDRPGAPAVGVMSYRTWQQQYGGDPSIVGSVLLVNDLPVTLVGIAPAGYEGARLTSAPPELWIPLNQQPAFEGQGQNSILYSSGMAWLYLIGRLKPGVTPFEVQPQLSAELQQYLRDEGRTDDDSRHRVDQQHIQLTPGGTGVSSFRNNSQRGLYLLSAVSVVVLLIACANLANLLLARSASCTQQTALRLSLGATRWRLIRTALTESLLLSLIGGAAGLLFAYTGTKAILLIIFRGAVYIPINASPSLPVLGFTLLLSVLTAVVFGAAPAWMGTRREPSEALRGISRSAASHSSGPQRTLVTAQAALSLVLLAVGGLVTQSLGKLEKVDLGFETRGRLLATISFKAAGYRPEQLSAFYGQLQDHLEKIPGVRSASFSLNSPQDLCCVNLNISIGGRSDRWIEDVNVVFDRVSPHYFQTIGTPLLRGRAIAEQDTPASQHVAVVDQSFVRKFFPGADPIGQHFGLSLPGHGYDYEIVGVVKDTKYRNPASVESPMFFLPFTQTTQYEVSGYRRMETGTLYAQSIQLSVAGIPENFENVLRNALANINPSLTPIRVRSYSEHVAIQYNQERLIARLTAVFGMLALLLASVGLYGVTAYNVARRTSEIGIRMALGADPGKVFSMVVRGAFLQVGVGLGLGIPVAIVCGRYLAHELYGLERFDPVVLCGASLVLVVCALVATVLPARRATRVDPMVALRYE
jgi:predicted permease